MTATFPIAAAIGPHPVNRRGWQDLGAILLALLLALIYSMWHNGTVRAAGITVGCDANELINAINTANANGEAESLELSANCAYTLTTVNNTDSVLGTNGLPVITTDLTLNGNGATIERTDTAGTPLFRLFQVNSGASLTLFDTTLSKGSVLGDGGAVYSSGTLNLIRTTVSDNETHCDFSEHVFTSGGGIYNQGVLTVTASTLAGNRGAGSSCEPGGQSAGGGIANSGTLVVQRSTFVNNTQHIASSGTMGVSNSTFALNPAAIQRGNAPAAPQLGTAISNSGTATLNNITLASTVPSSSILNNGFGATLTLQNSLIWAEGSSFGCSGTIVDGGGNVSWPRHENACVGRRGDPELGPLQDNGGPTQTMALGLNSVAINAAVDADCLATDQRGISRPQGKHCDSGAFELEKPDVPELIAPPDGKRVSSARVSLRWMTSERAEIYHVIVREDSTIGEKIVRANVAETRYQTKALQRRHWYYWRIRACSKVGCTASLWQKFRVTPAASDPPR